MGDPNTHAVCADANGGIDRGLRISIDDWGDCCATHPFFTMVVALKSVAKAFRLEESSPELAELRDIYLEAWAGYASRQTLLAAFDLAQCVGTICRALAEQIVMAQADETEKTKYAREVPAWLQEFLKRIEQLE